VQQVPRLLQVPPEAQHSLLPPPQLFPVQSTPL
jgi:hypothetical protein